MSLNKKRRHIKLDPDKLDAVIHKFRRSLAKITKEFSDEIWEIYSCVVEGNDNNDNYNH